MFLCIFICVFKVDKKVGKFFHSLTPSTHPQTLFSRFSSNLSKVGRVGDIDIPPTNLKIITSVASDFCEILTKRQAMDPCNSLLGCMLSPKMFLVLEKKRDGGEGGRDSPVLSFSDSAISPRPLSVPPLLFDEPIFSSRSVRSSPRDLQPEHQEHQEQQDHHKKPMKLINPILPKKRSKTKLIAPNTSAVASFHKGHHRSSSSCAPSTPPSPPSSLSGAQSPSPRHANVRSSSPPPRKATHTTISVPNRCPSPPALGDKRKKLGKSKMKKPNSKLLMPASSFSSFSAASTSSTSSPSPSSSGSQINNKTVPRITAVSSTFSVPLSSLSSSSTTCSSQSPPPCSLTPPGSFTASTSTASTSTPPSEPSRTPSPPNTPPKSHSTSPKSLFRSGTPNPPPVRKLASPSPPPTSSSSSSSSSSSAVVLARSRSPPPLPSPLSHSSSSLPFPFPSSSQTQPVSPVPPLPIPRVSPAGKHQQQGQEEEGDVERELNSAKNGTKKKRITRAKSSRQNKATTPTISPTKLHQTKTPPPQRSALLQNQMMPVAGGPVEPRTKTPPPILSPSLEKQKQPQEEEELLEDKYEKLKQTILRFVKREKGKGKGKREKGKGKWKREREA